MGMFKCNTFDECDINILSFSQLAKLYNISYNQKMDRFVVHTDKLDLLFEKEEGQYCSNMQNWKPRSHSVFNIVSDREKLYTKKELEGARMARIFQKNAGCLSYERAVRMIEGNQIEGMTLTKENLDIAYDIYGPVVQEVRGKLTKKKVRSHAGVLLDNECGNKSQNLAMDIFYVGKEKFILSVMLPMGLCLVNRLDNRSTDSIIQVLGLQLSMLKNRGYIISRITTDSEPSFKILQDKFSDLHLNIGGAGDRVANADIRIRRIKEICRSVVAGLRWKVPTCIIDYLVRFAVGRYNLQQSDKDKNCARVQFNGWKPNFNKELGLCFGDYAEVYNPSCISNNALQSRSEPCIALCPSGNTHGSWFFLNLNTNKVVMRTNWKRMFTNDWIITRMCAIAKDDAIGVDHIDVNELSGVENVIISENNENLLESTIINEDLKLDIDRPIEIETDVMVSEASNKIISDPDDDILLQNLVNENCVEDNMLLKDFINYEDDNSPDSAELEIEMEYAPTNLRRSSRPGITKPAGFYEEVDTKRVKSILHLSMKQGIKLHKELAVIGINSEFQQMIDKRVWTYVLSYYGSYLRSSMFLKEKIDMDGMVYKVKARLVADGSTQVLQPYEFTFTPTIKSSSIMCLLKIAAVEKRIIKCIDISGAYLHAEMKGDVFMNLDKQLVDHLVKIDENCKDFIKTNGSVMVKLNKALYGCKNSGLLWFERLTNYLKKIKFIQNPSDECVFNIVRNGCQISIGLHVDDLLITTVSEENYAWVSEMLKLEFQEITEQTENKITYLGMQIENVGNGFYIKMPNMVDDILDGITGKSNSPASEDLFEVGESSDLTESEREYFHSTTAKLLYLAGKLRNDILLAVSFLCTRVISSTKNDLLKLNRLLKYLNCTRERFIYVSDKPIDIISATIDASFAAHEDGKSHTGQVIMLGDMVVQAKSSKQKIVTKDSTEAELVGMADKMLDVICLSEFIKNQGLTIDTPILYQDNKSTIQWVSNNSKKLRNKYMLVRQELVKQGIANKDFKIEYLKTADMVADILTKPLHGNLFKRLRELLSGANCDQLLGVTLDSQANACDKFSTEVISQDNLIKQGC